MPEESADGEQHLHKIKTAISMLDTARDHLYDHKPLKAYDKVTSAMQTLEEIRTDVEEYHRCGCGWDGETAGDHCPNCGEKWASTSVEEVDDGE